MSVIHVCPTCQAKMELAEAMPSLMCPKCRKPMRVVGDAAGAGLRMRALADALRDEGLFAVFEVGMSNVTMVY